MKAFVRELAFGFQLAALVAVALGAAASGLFFVRLYMGPNGDGSHAVAGGVILVCAVGAFSWQYLGWAEFARAEEGYGWVRHSAVTLACLLCAYAAQQVLL